MMIPDDVAGKPPINKNAAWELEELLVKIVVQDSLRAASGTSPTEVASEFQEEELEKAQLEHAMNESLLEAKRAQRRRQDRDQREQMEVQQAIAASLTTQTIDTWYRQRDGGHIERLDIEQAIETSLTDITNTRPRPREGDRHRRVGFQQGTVGSHTETTAAIEASLNKTTTQRNNLKRDRSKLEELELPMGIDASPSEIANKRPRYTSSPLTANNNTQTRPRHNEARNPSIPRSAARTTVSRAWQLPTRPAQPRSRPEARVAVNRTGATGRPVDRTQGVDPRLERTPTANPRPDQTRPIYPRPDQTRPVYPRPDQTRPIYSRPVGPDATGGPTGRARTPDPRRDRTRNAGHITERTRPVINRPADRPRPVDARPDRTRATARRPINRARNADYLLDSTVGRTINRPVEIPRAAPNPIPELRPVSAVPVTATEVYQWLRTREGPRPVAKCFGACGNKLVFRGLQSDNGRREPCIILGCGHLVGGKCFSDLVDMAKTSGEDVPCPHCGRVPTSAAV